MEGTLPNALATKGRIRMSKHPLPNPIPVQAVPQGASRSAAIPSPEISENLLTKELLAEASEPGADRFLVLMRHGIAEERSEAQSDEERALTKKGAMRMKEIGGGLAEIYPNLDVIFTSPLVRAHQSGACLAKGYGDPTPIRMTEALEPGQGPAAFRALLEAAPLKRMVFIGHEPDLTRIMGDLCRLDTATMALKKGGCYGIRIRADGGAGLEWMLPPGILRQIKE